MQRLPITHQFSHYIKQNFPKHSHLETAIRVFECVDYIESDLTNIASKAGQVSLLRHPTNHMAFHLNGLRTPAEVRDQFTLLINEVHGALDGLLSIEDTKIQEQVINIFLNHINDSDIGCMEVRLRNALTFYGIFQSTGLLNINNLMEDFYNEIGGINADIKVEDLLGFFSDKVENNLLITNLNNEVEPLTWDLIQHYLQVTFDLDIKQAWLNYGKNNTPLVIEEKRRKIWHHLYFNDEQSANRYLSYVKSILPFSYQPELAKASIKKDRMAQYSFSLTAAQYNEVQLILDNLEINLSDLKTNLVVENEKKIIEDENLISKKSTFQKQNVRSNAFANELAERFMRDGALVKSVRWDNRCFNLKFIDGVTKSPEKEIKEDQRKGAHKKFTTYATGAYSRDKKPSPYPWEAEKTAKKKQKRSAHQSTSLITPKAQIPVFGHNRARADKLVGYLFDPDDAMLNRMFIYDGGTVGRPYEFDTYEEALAYYNQKTNPDHPILFSEREAFEKAIESQNNKYNEVLARTRWNIKSSSVGIFSDSFEARCIAQLYAEQMRKRLSEQYKELHKKLDDSYDIPIIYYIPGNPKCWSVYSDDQQKQDRIVANRIFKDEQLRKKAFADNNFEFLLLIDNPKDVFNLKLNNEPLLHHLLYKGELHLVEALCDRTNLKPSEIENYFKTAHYKKLPTIDNTGKTALHLAAESGHSTLKLLLANKNIDPNTIDNEGWTALHTAASNSQTETIKLLLADTRVNIDILDKNGWTALMQAARYANVESIQVLLNDKRINKKLLMLENKGSLTVPMLASYNDDKEVLKALLNDPRIDVNATNSVGFTILLTLALTKNPEAIKILLSDNRITVENINASISAFLTSGTALELAVLKNQIENVKVLLADPRVKVDIPKLVSSAKKAKELSNELRELIFNTVLERYSEKIAKRSTSFESKIPGFGSLGLFGYSRDDKIKALADYFDAKNNDVKIHDKKSIGALHDGELGEIMELLSDTNKTKLGL